MVLSFIILDYRYFKLLLVVVISIYYWIIVFPFLMQPHSIFLTVYPSTNHHEKIHSQSWRYMVVEYNSPVMVMIINYR